MSSTKRNLIIICNYEGNAYFEELRSKTQFATDPREFVKQLMIKTY